ncbi:TonB family protein [candidate division KSB1 bacterium]|nr:TonB family protein [candidate division KSB1 bacterium]
MDRTFLIVLALSFLFHFTTVIYFVLNPLPSKGIVHTEALKRVQESYANVVLESTPLEFTGNMLTLPPAVKQEIERFVPSSGSSETAPPSSVLPTQTPPATANLAETKSPGGTVDRGVGRGGGITGTGNPDVANQGLLGILTSPSGDRTDNAIQDVLAQGTIQEQDYDKALRNMDRLASRGQSTSGGGVEGSGTGGSGGVQRQAITSGRRTEGGNLDGVVTGLGSAESAAFQRQADFAASQLAPLTDEGEEIQTSGGRLAGRDINLVSTVVYGHSAAIQYCYERELKRNPDLKGKVVIRFTITPAGQVTNPRIVSSTLKSESVERCILSRVSRWDDFGQIDASLGNATFRQVYTFGF